MIYRLTSIKGKESGDVLFDDDDVMLLFNYRWHLARRSKRCVYASSRINSGGDGIYMHQLIMRPPNGLVVDHINGNGLDNRRCNLRLATIALNLRNTPPLNGRKFKGVYYAKRGKTPLKKSWAAKLHTAKKDLHLGYFKTEIEAARAYNKAAKEYFGDFAWLNPIDNEESA